MFERLNVGHSFPGGGQAYGVVIIWKHRWRNRGACLKQPSKRDSSVRPLDYTNSRPMHDERESQGSVKQSLPKNAASPTCMETPKEMVAGRYIYKIARGVTDGYSILWSCREGSRLAQTRCRCDGLAVCSTLRDIEPAGDLQTNCFSARQSDESLLSILQLVIMSSIASPVHVDD
ncbi:hypothetical protein ARMGADRAFT_1079561 [Armillaria gallica]|uniref:Uncharacterized protein n=1 Tax=Armillaria gallica TaxID=47427 RepID=A0A2H3DFT5_ARMGA|nr:hypothetical protein ARMGADRAFT_1079561 [Armillaria gallica]